MNEEVLHNVLNEVLEEQKNLTKEIQFLTTAIEVNYEETKEFQSFVKGITVEVPIKPVTDIVNQGIKYIKDVVEKQPKEVLHEKRILFYPEGNGENFLKLICTRLIWTFCIIGTVWIIIKAGGPYYNENSENARYKQAFQWVYMNISNKGQDYLLNAFQEMNNDSIREIRVKQIENYLKKYPK